MAGDFRIQWKDCFDRLSDLLQNSEFKPFRISVFIHTENETDYHSKSVLIQESFERIEYANTWPVGIISQSPEEPFEIVIELGMVSEKEGKVKYYSIGDLNYCTITSGELIEYWMVGAGLNSKSNSILESADNSFRKLSSVLNDAKVNFDTIVRQWNYIGEILNESKIDGNYMQHYQQFNEVRNSYYSQFRKCACFPAATGIGIKYANVGIDLHAVESNSSIEIIPVRNPVQDDSYHYGQDVLVGNPVVHKQPPQFERALLLTLGTSSRLIISGTASIVGQKTIGIGDVELQTKFTINNIEILSSHSNLKNQYPNLATYPDKYCYLRVYVRNRSDINAVKKICRDHYGDVPMTFIQADICRENLLVEIEAEKINF